MRLCKEQNIPESEWIIDDATVSIVFRRRAAENGGQKGGQKKGESGQKIDLRYLSVTAQSIIDLIVSNPKVTRAEMAEKIGVAPSAIQKHLKKLKEANLVFREGGDKGGSWVVNNAILDH